MFFLNKFFTIFLTSLLLVSLSHAQDNILQKNYENYIQSIQDMNSIDDRNFETFISTRAQKVIEDKTQNFDKKFNDAFLRFFKAEAIIPNDSEITSKLDSETGVLTITTNNYPEKGSKQVTNVFYVKENGWKIDKVVSESTSGDSSVKSTTY